MRDVKVTLTPLELSLAAMCGVRRQIASLLGGHPNAHGLSNKDGWREHIEGACGEMSTAKVIGCYWEPTVNTFRAPDLCGWIQVKTTSADNGHLIIHDGCNPEHAYVLVTGRSPDFIVRGWIMAKDATRDEWWRTVNPERPCAWYVPQSALLDLDELLQLNTMRVAA